MEVATSPLIEEDNDPSLARYQKNGDKMTISSSMKKRKKLIDLTDATSTAKRVEEQMATVNDDHKMKDHVINHPQSAASHSISNDGNSSGALRLVLLRTKKVLE